MGKGKGERHTPKNSTSERKKKKEKQARGRQSPEVPAVAPHAWRGARQRCRDAQRLSAQDPSLSTVLAGAGSGHRWPGRQGRGRGAAQQPSVHTHCAIPQQRRLSVRPSASWRGQTDTPARRSRMPVGYQGNSGRGWRAHAPPSKPRWRGTTVCRGTAGSARSETCGGEEPR